MKRLFALFVCILSFLCSKVSAQDKTEMKNHAIDFELLTHGSYFNSKVDDYAYDFSYNEAFYSLGVNYEFINRLKVGVIAGYKEIYRGHNNIYGLEASYRLLPFSMGQWDNNTGFSLSLRGAMYNRYMTRASEIKEFTSLVLGPQVKIKLFKKLGVMADFAPYRVGNGKFIYNPTLDFGFYVRLFDKR